MTIKIDEHLMTLQVGGAIVASASRTPDGWRQVSHWPEFDRNRAITGLRSGRGKTTGQPPSRTSDTDGSVSAGQNRFGQRAAPAPAASEIG
jgi:hypothetical protein